MLYYKWWIGLLCTYIKLKVKVKALFIYIVDRKASAYNCHFFCSACFQLCSTTTGTLLLIRRPHRVSGRVDHGHLHTRTHLVVQGVRTLRQWFSFPEAGTIWSSYCNELDLSQPTNQLASQPHSTKLLRGGAEVLQTNGRGSKTVKFVGLPRPLYTIARVEIRTHIEAIACYNLKQMRYRVS